MGHTNYWSFNFAVCSAAELERRYQRAVRACQMLVRSHSLKHGGLAGWTAHVEPGKYGGLLVNGSREDGAEPFALREHCRENESSGFCKTYGRPYDAVVRHCLRLLKRHLGDAFTFHYDGMRRK